jgi:hypothetical protein
MRLTKQQILDAQDRKRKTIVVPEWGGEVVIAELSAMDVERWRKGAEPSEEMDGEAGIYLRLLAASIEGEDGSPLFEPTDLAALGGKNSKVIKRLFGEIVRLSALGDEGADEIKNG